MNILGTLVERPIIKQDFDKNYKVLVDMYAEEIENCKSVFDKHVKDHHNQVSKIIPTASNTI